MDFPDYPKPVVEDIVRIRRRIDKSQIPIKQVDQNLIIGTWNIRAFGQIFNQWMENAGNPKRNLRALACIAEIVRHFDVLAVQEVKSDTSGVQFLMREFLGPDWGLIMSDVSGGAAGNAERLSFIFDKRRVQPSGLAGEIVLPPTPDGNPMTQFDRTPYIVGFQSKKEHFALLTAHIRYGKIPTDRIGEITALAQYIASAIRDRIKTLAEERNLIVLGDFNIEERGTNPLFQAFISTGLVVPEALLNLRSTYDTKAKYYDQIAWFMGGLDLLTAGRAGVIDFAGAVFKELTLPQMTYRMSDHFPLWCEFLIDRSPEQMATTLGVDPGMPDPFSGVPD
ncbi:MAG TPA: endonuclease/exonuclease/phosphatase family protein [Anaerolineales bacterium]